MNNNIKERIVLLGYQHCNQTLKYKVAQNFPKVAQIVTTAVYIVHENGYFQNSLKNKHSFGLLYKKMSPRILKNDPIRSHWLHVSEGQFKIFPKASRQRIVVF